VKVNTVADCRPIPEGDTLRLATTGARFEPAGAVVVVVLAVEFPPQAAEPSSKTATTSVDATDVQSCEYF